MEAKTLWVARLHEVVNELAGPIAAAHGERLRCRAGCAGCCADELTVFELEADLIRARHAELLAREAPHAPGACAFLDAAGACRIYDARPYVCRTQGLPLRWLEEDDDGDVVEGRDVCPLNDEGPPLEELPAEQLWTIGPFEQRLQQQQLATDGGEGRRVALRSLFARAAEPKKLPVR